MLPVIGDEHRLQQVVWNLLANALKYTPPGGTSTIAAAQPTAAAPSSACATTARASIPTFLPHIFEPFRQGASKTMRTGLGLGLAIVKRLVDLHGGRITAESEGAGQGLGFTVSVCRWRKARPRRPTARRRPEPNFDHLHVLVAEDDADSAAAVTAILQASRLRNADRRHRVGMPAHHRRMADRRAGVRRRLAG